MQRGIVFAVDDFLPLVDMARAAEDRGFDMVWTTENHERDGFIRLAPMIQATSRIQVGTGIAYAFTRHPIQTAAIAADLDELSGGRMVVGLGTGTKGMRRLWYGLEWEHPAPRMKEYATVMRAAWQAADPPQPLAFHGRFYDCDIARHWRPNLVRADIPLYAAALNAGMIRAAAEAFDGIALFPIAIAKPYFEQVVRPNIAVGARRAGKAAGDVKVAAWLITAIAADSAEAKRMAKHQLSFYLSTRSYGAVPDTCGWEQEKLKIQEIYNRNREQPDWEAMADAVTDEMQEAMSLAGTLDEVREKVESFADRADMLVFQTTEAGLSQEEVLESCRLIVDTLGVRT